MGGNVARLLSVGGLRIPRRDAGPFVPRVTLVVALMACSLPCVAGSTDPPPELIAFSSYRDGNWDVWATPPRGGAPVRVTRSPDDEKAPDFAPDGRRIVYGDNRGRLWVSRVDSPGEEPTLLPVGDGAHSQPAWIPDASKIVFSTRPDPAQEIAELCFLAFEEQQPLRGRGVLFSKNGVAMFPDVSPDGRQMAFSFFDKPSESDLRLPRKPTVEEVYILDVPTGRVQQITQLGVNSTDPAFSPDGGRIAFSSNAAGHGYDIWVMGVTPDGGEPRRITIHEGYEGSPCWSPDGTRVAFASDRSGNLEIWTAPVDGGEWEQVTRTPEGADSMEPSWVRTRPASDVQKSPPAAGAEE